MIPSLSRLEARLQESGGKRGDREERGRGREEEGKTTRRKGALFNILAVCYHILNSGRALRGALVLEKREEEGGKRGEESHDRLR